MNLLDIVAEALKFYARHEHWMQIHESAEASRVLIANGQHHTTGDGWEEAAEALAAVREAQANPQGFEAWSRGDWPIWNIRNPKATFGQKLRVAYLAGQLSGIPAELRETLIDALDEAYGEYQRNAKAWAGRSKEKKYQDAVKAIDEARKWLEGAR